jgi:peptidoglycan/xylan/chitin deacetylase (PgdA/CDA1 family)
MSENSIPALHKILENLKKRDLKALFFITGHMAEKLYNFPIIVDLLNEHQIGYHTSSHSVHPTIFEFTDVKNYEEAYKTSLQRETAHINPLTGEVEGQGGIHALRNLFPTKQIVAFRAPGHCWSPPHLEALKSLGISYDFSTNLSLQPISYKDLTFYPYPMIGHWQGTPSEYRLLLISLRHSTTVLTIHPSLLVNQHEWDLIYWKSNPNRLSQPPARSHAETVSLFHRFDLLLRQIRNLQKMHFIEVTPALKKPKKTLSPTRIDAEKCYQTSMRWATKQKYKPKFLHYHFLKFFEINSAS